jgi:hypothetical protein
MLSGGIWSGQMRFQACWIEEDVEGSGTDVPFFD